jgi:antitoxin component of MazEF toxin-antitoxin module
MIASKLERIGDRLALILDADDLAALGARVGDTVNLELASDGIVRVSAQETWVEDAHARGRAFLKRYRRTFEQLS